MIQVDISKIIIGDRVREHRPDQVLNLLNSMRVIGLHTPITVVPTQDGETYRLVAGRHRLEPVRQLGWKEIAAFVDEPEKAELWEIDENLARCDLSPAERLLHLVLRKEAWERRRSSGATWPTSSSRTGFAAATAEAIGGSKRSINRELARAAKIPANLLRHIAHTPLDVGTYLDDLAKLAPDQQDAKVARDLVSGSGGAQADAGARSRAPMPRGPTRGGGGRQGGSQAAGRAAPRGEGGEHQAALSAIYRLHADLQADIIQAAAYEVALRAQAPHVLVPVLRAVVFNFMPRKHQLEILAALGDQVRGADASDASPAATREAEVSAQPTYHSAATALPSPQPSNQRSRRRGPHLSRNAA